MTEPHAGNIKGEKDKARAQRVKENYAVVGELVLMSTGLDFLLNRVLMAVLDLGTSRMIEPVVATLDPTRKLEILKERAAHIANADWKKGVTKFCDKVESVFRQRNIACHTPPIFDDGGSPPSAPLWMSAAAAGNRHSAAVRRAIPAPRRQRRRSPKPPGLL